MHNVKVGVGQDAGAQGGLYSPTSPHKFCKNDFPVWLFFWEPWEGIGTLSSFVRQVSGLSVCVGEGEQSLLGSGC